MNARTILFECRRRGVRLNVDGDKLRIIGSPSQLTDQFAVAIRASKPELIALLLTRAAPLSPPCPPLSPPLSPLGDEGGLTRWTQAESGNPSPEGRNDQETFQTSLLSPPSPPCSSIGASRAGGFFPTEFEKRGENDPQTGQNDHNQVGEIISPVQDPSLPRGSGLGGLSGLSASRWAELSAQRWGPGLLDDYPSIIIDRPSRDRMRDALAAIQSDQGDAYEGDLLDFPTLLELDPDFLTRMAS